MLGKGVCVCVFALALITDSNEHPQSTYGPSHLLPVWYHHTAAGTSVIDTHVYVYSHVCDCVTAAARVFTRLRFQKASQVSALAVNTHTDTL